MGENDEMVTHPAVLSPRAVLIVEDSAHSAATIEMALLDLPGISVLLAGSALEALRIVDSLDSPVDAIITDLNMPRMDGFEFIQRIRSNERTSVIPIIVVSGDTDPETPARVARMKVDAFFAKPFSPAQVRRKLEQILNGTKT
jgi:two-component system, chemotaxis family, chemotaxis protein CheY